MPEIAVVDLLGIYRHLHAKSRFDARALKMARSPESGNPYWDACRKLLRDELLRSGATTFGWYAWVGSLPEGRRRIIHVGQSSVAGRILSLESVIAWEVRAWRYFPVGSCFAQEALEGASTGYRVKPHAPGRSSSCVREGSQRTGATAILLMPATQDVRALRDHLDRTEALLLVEQRLIDALQPCANERTTCDVASPLAPGVIDQIAADYARQLRAKLEHLPELPRAIVRDARISYCPAVCTKPCRK